MIGRAIAVILATCTVWAEPSKAVETFVAGPGDRLSVTVHRRADLSGEFRVLPSGALSLPLVGNLAVANRPIDQIRDLIAQRLREDAGLLDPRVSVEISEMQPILVAGSVRRPGQYPFQFGMTVGHALAAAGGLRRFEPDEIGARIEVLRLREKLRLAQDALGVALVRQARLRAEAAEQEELKVSSLTVRHLSEERLRQTVEAEQEIMRRRLAAHTSTITMLATQTTSYEDEIRALTDQDATKGRELQLLTDESTYLDDLIRKGLSPRTSRVSELARFAVQVEGDRRQIQAFAARARQEIVRLEQTRITSITSRRLEIATALKDVDDTIATLRVGIEEGRAGLAQLRDALPGDDEPLGPSQPGVVSILRVRSGPPQRIKAEAQTELMPGDLVDATPEDGVLMRRLASGGVPEETAASAPREAKQ